MSSARLMSLIQVLFALAGMAWKLKEGYALVDVPDLRRLVVSIHKEGLCQGLHTWVEVLGGVSLQSMRDDWPWFSLHLFLYLGQIIPFTILVMNETPSAKAWKPLKMVGVLGALSVVLGFSTAMPITSLWILHGRQRGQYRGAAGRYRKPILKAVFWFSAATHVGAFLVAFTATWTPSMLGPRAASALHVANSLTGVPASVPAGVSGTGIQQARLRQINEMTGTSSGFFMTAGLLCLGLESKGRQLTAGLLVWMFLVSLVAGPAAGGAAVLLLRDSIVNGSAPRGGGARERNEKRVS